MRYIDKGVAEAYNSARSDADCNDVFLENHVTYFDAILITSNFNLLL